MLDILVAAFAAFITAWVLVLLWQVARGAVPAKVVTRLSRNPRAIRGYSRAGRTVMVGSIALIIPAALLLLLYLEKSPGITLWLVWAVAALVVGGVLLSRRIVQTASAAERATASGRSQSK